MLQTKFSEKVAKDALGLLHKKGWNLYKSESDINSKRDNSHEIIRKHLADKIKVETPYVMLPVANNPNDPEQVFEALKFVINAKNRGEMIKIRVGGFYQNVTGMTFGNDFVKFHTEGFGTYISYIELPRVLETLIDANNKNARV